MEILHEILFYLSIGIEAFCLSYILAIIYLVIDKKTYEFTLKNIFICYLPLLALLIISHIMTIHFVDCAWQKPILNLIAITIISKFLLKLSTIKAVFTATLTLLLTGLVELIAVVIVNLIDLTPLEVLQNSNYSSIILLVISFLYFIAGHIISVIYRKTVLKDKIQDEFCSYLFPQFFAIAICLIPNMALLMKNYFEYSGIFIILNIVQVVIISAISLYNVKNCLEQKITEQQLAKTITYNETLVQVNEGVRGFKHDMGNIVQAILGYIAVGDAEGAKKYCQGLVLGFNDINVLSILSPTVINEPAIYGIVANKILIAREQNMQLCLDISSDVSKINFPKFELSRILGILIDNAIEAGTNTKEKKLKFNISCSPDESYDEIVVSNSISTTNIPLDKIFAKNYSTKANPSGFGLYEVKKILSKNKQAVISTSISDEKMMLIQKIKIFR